MTYINFKIVTFLTNHQAVIQFGVLQTRLNESHFAQFDCRPVTGGVAPSDSEFQH
jgi:hypothetical protein